MSPPSLFNDRREAWAYVVAWLGTLGAIVGLFALASEASRGVILNALVPALATLASAAALWLRSRRTTQAVERTEQLVERRTNGELSARMEAASARGAAAVLGTAVPPQYADDPTPTQPEEVTDDGQPPPADPRPTH
jgi:hypothetical protein